MERTALVVLTTLSTEDEARTLVKADLTRRRSRSLYWSRRMSGWAVSAKISARFCRAFDLGR